MLPDDIKHIAVSVLSHRLILKPESQLRGKAPEQVVQELLQTTPVKFEKLGEAT